MAVTKAKKKVVKKVSHGIAKKICTFSCYCEFQPESEIRKKTPFNTKIFLVPFNILWIDFAILRELYKNLNL